MNMLKKEGVIEPKITNKPSFKNILKLEQVQVPASPSRSKSKKSTSQRKVSTLKNKSPKKIINRPSGNQSAMEYASTTSIDNPNYTAVHSQASIAAPKSPKKDKTYQQTMKNIIILKNKVVQIQKDLNIQQEKAQNKKSKNSKNDRAGGTVGRLKSKISEIQQHEKKAKFALESLQKQYFQKIQQIEKSIKNEQVNYQQKQKKSLVRISPGMPTLQSKLQKLSFLLE